MFFGTIDIAKETFTGSSARTGESHGTVESITERSISPQKPSLVQVRAPVSHTVWNDQYRH
jgi:hypothetical protein